MPRFTVSHHTGSKEGDHYDLMFEHGETLRTWRFSSPTLVAPQTARQIKDHRKIYLDFEGEVTGGRGRVKIWDTGQYLPDSWTEKRIVVAVVGKTLRTRLRLDLKGDSSSDKEPPWTLVDATGAVRKSASAFLRDSGLEEAPSSELEEIRRALAHEEQQLMGVVGQYTRGGTVEWSLAETDSDLRRKIESAKVRWQHPWLAAAKSFASRLEDLAGLLRDSRPA